MVKPIIDCPVHLGPLNAWHEHSWNWLWLSRLSVISGSGSCSELDSSCWLFTINSSWMGSRAATWAELLVALGILGLCLEYSGLFQNTLQLISLSKLDASWKFLLYLLYGHGNIFSICTVNTIGLPGTLNYRFQDTSKVCKRQYLLTSCLQTIFCFELNPLHEKLFFQ